MNDFKLEDIRKLIGPSLRWEPSDDGWQPYHRLFYLIAESLDPALIVYVHKDAEDEVLNVETLDRVIDFLYLDTRHEHIASVWELYEPLLADVALIVCDYFPSDGKLLEGDERSWWSKLSESGEIILSSEVHPGSLMAFVKYARTATNQQKEFGDERLQTGRHQEAD